MIEIIEDKATKYIVTCNNCKSILRFKKNDINYHTENLFGQYHDHSFIMCPCCKNEIVLSVDGKMQTQYDVEEQKEFE